MLYLYFLSSFCYLFIHLFKYFIRYSGDASAHNLDGEFPDHTTRRERVLKAMETATDEVKLAFPMLPFFPSLGNNDLPGHYVLPERGDSWYQDLLNFWEESILCESCELRQRTTTRRALRKTFLKGGYYKVNLPGLNINITTSATRKFLPPFGSASVYVLTE